MKINISMNDELVTRLDKYADDNYTTRSGLITTALTQYLNGKEMVLAIKQMGLAMKRISESGEIDNQTQRELEDFERLCQMFAQSSSSV